MATQNDYFYIGTVNVVDIVLMNNLTFTTRSVYGTGISPSKLVDPSAPMSGDQKKFGFVINMQTAPNSSIYRYNLPSGTIVRAAYIGGQNFKILDYQLPSSGFLPIKNNTSLNFFPNVIADSSSGAITLSLPSSSGSGWIGQNFCVQKIDSSTNSIFISGISGDKIDGQSTYEITHPFESVKVLSNGSGWYTY